MHWYPDFPDQVYVELTNVCNARCTICATPTMKRAREIMPMPLFEKIVANAAGSGRPRSFLFCTANRCWSPARWTIFAPPAAWRHAAT